MSLFDPLQWIVTAMVVLIILLVVGGVLLRFFRALTGEMPADEGKKRPSNSTDTLKPRLNLK